MYHTQDLSCFDPEQSIYFCCWVRSVWEMSVVVCVLSYWVPVISLLPSDVRLVADFLITQPGPLWRSPDTKAALNISFSDTVQLMDLGLTVEFGGTGGKWATSCNWYNPACFSRKMGEKLGTWTLDTEICSYFYFSRNSIQQWVGQWDCGKVSFSSCLIFASPLQLPSVSSTQASILHQTRNKCWEQYHHLSFTSVPYT